MHTPEIITSRQNQRIKHLLRLQKRQVRAEEGLFVIEGLKEIEKAVHAGYEFVSVYYCAKIITFLELKKLVHDTSDDLIFEISVDVFEKIAYRENSGGVVVVAKEKEHKLETLTSKANPLYLIVEGVEKPGNLGAIYRTADAAGVDAIIVCDPKADLYNPNVVRASLGCVFTVPTAISENAETIYWLKKHKIQILSTYLKAAIPYHTADFTQPTAIVMGTEATGISDDWVQSSDAHIIIPMKGIADSMNVSVSTAIVVFEAMRQRGFR